MPLCWSGWSTNSSPITVFASSGKIWAQKKGQKYLSITKKIVFADKPTKRFLKTSRAPWATFYNCCCKHWSKVFTVSVFLRSPQHVANRRQESWVEEKKGAILELYVLVFHVCSGLQSCVSKPECALTLTKMLLLWTFTQVSSCVSFNIFMWHIRVSIILLIVISLQVLW